MEEVPSIRLLSKIRSHLASSSVAKFCIINDNSFSIENALVLGAGLHSFLLSAQSLKYKRSAAYGAEVPGLQLQDNVNIVQRTRIVADQISQRRSLIPCLSPGWICLDHAIQYRHGILMLRRTTHEPSCQ